MPGSIRFFDEVANEGRNILRVLGGQPLAESYLGLVAETYETLAQIHDNVVEVAFRVDQATSIDDAKATLRALGSSEIERELRAQHLCDKLQMLGAHLRDQGLLQELSLSLEGRERATAEMYAENLIELSSLPYTVSGLDSLIEQVDDISNRLMIQKAEFDFLAKKARAMQLRGH
jgi:hypothetical protein